MSMRAADRHGLNEPFGARKDMAPSFNRAGTFRRSAASNDAVALDSTWAMQTSMAINGPRFPDSTMSSFMNCRSFVLTAAFLIGIWLVSRLAPFGIRSADAGEIGWIEDYSLAADRSVPLKQLIPGTEDYYYYYCLSYQSTEQWQKAD